MTFTPVFTQYNARPSRKKACIKQGIIRRGMMRARYRRIVLFFTRILISFLTWDVILPAIGLGGWARKTRPKRLQRSAEAFRNLAIQMGGVMIKVGQFLSSRVDVLPDEIISELAGLQDEVPPEDFASIRQVAEAEFDAPLTEMYSEFEELPLAAASLGQVHKASIVRGDGQPPLSVVVKIQRPDIERLIATDLAALRTVGSWIGKYKPISKRADIAALLAEFTRILYEEIDYLAEGRNAEKFSVNFKTYPGVRIPRTVWTHTTRKVLTLENVYAIKITEYETITEAGIQRSEVASRLIDTYLKQIFEDGFFHADPHPGNLFVYPKSRRQDDVSASDSNEITWDLTFVDFGMVGRVPANLIAGLREMLIALGTRDAGRLVNSYQKLGVLLPGADLTLLERAEARAFEHWWGKSMSEIQQISGQELREYAVEFRELIYRLPFQVPHNLIFLGRAVGILSGICTGLDPNFNVWKHLAPYAQKLLSAEVKEGWQAWLDELKVLTRSLWGIPGRVNAMLGKVERGEIAVRTPEVTEEVIRLENTIRQLVWGIVFAAFLLAGIQLYLAGHQPMSYLILGGAATSLIWSIWSGRYR